MPLRLSDDELVQRFQETQDNDSFAELFVRYRRPVYLACRRFFQDGGAAEDATQEAFLRAYKNLHRFQGGDVCGWLIRIAKNACIDLWRKRRLKTAMDERELAAVPADQCVDQSVDASLAVEQIYREMQVLPDDQRRCLELKIDGYSYEETAASLRLSVSAVKSHLQNGRRMLWLKMEATLCQLK